MTQVQVADRLGIPPNTLALWERGALSIRHPTILGLALAGLAAHQATP